MKKPKTARWHLWEALPGWRKLLCSLGYHCWVTEDRGFRECKYCGADEHLYGGERKE